jgi:hypothetical protein
LAEKKRHKGNINEVETFANIDDEMAEVEEKEKRFTRMGEALNSLGEPCRTIIEDF